MVVSYREGRQVLEGLCPKIKCTTGWNKLGGQDRDEFDCANEVASAVERWPQRLLQDSKHLSAAVFSRNSWCFGILNQFLIACKAVSSLVTIALTGTWIVELGEVRLLSLHLLKDNRTLCSEYVTKGEKTSVQTHGGAWVSYGRNPCQRSMTDFFFSPNGEWLKLLNRWLLSTHFQAGKSNPGQDCSLVSPSQLVPPQ